MCQLTQVILCARAFEVPVGDTRLNVTHQQRPESDWLPETCVVLWQIISPLANFESARGKSILPAVLIILRVENSVFVFLRRDVLLPLFLAVAVFTTQPTVIASL